MVLEVPTKLCPCPVVPIAKTLDQNECNRLFDRVGVTRLRVVNQIMKLAFRQITNITCCVIGHDCVEDPFQLKQDNVSDHRAGTIDLQAEKSTRKSGFACIALLFRGFPASDNFVNV